MRSLVVFLFLSLLLWGNLPALADEGKTSTTTKTETEEGTDESKIHLDVVFSRPHTRSLPLVSPEAILSGSCICVTFEEAVPSAVVYIVKAGSGDEVYAMPYAYAAEVDIDLSAYPQGAYELWIETETATYKGTFSL